MKKYLFCTIFILIILVLSGQLSAQSNSINAKAEAEIIKPLTIVDNSGLTGGTTLNFGAMTISVISGGTCTISTLNVRSYSGGVNGVSSSASSTASFSITGKPGADYAISISPATVLVTRTGGTETMNINTLTVRPSLKAIDQLIGTLDASGNDTFTVGGTLQVTANQAEGVYDGTFSVTAAYN
jgi:hypothetical protein